MIQETIKKWQPKLLDQFADIVKAQQLSHAYLFSGTMASLEMALWLCQSLFCSQKENSQPCGHCRNCRMVEEEEFADLHVIRPQGNTIKTDTIREVVKQFSQSGFESDKQAFIICDAEKMHVNAANSLLKVMEEPESNSLVFLLTNQEEAVLPTIKSRAQIVQFPKNVSVLQEELEKEGLLPSEARLLSELSASKEEAHFLMKNKSLKDAVALAPKLMQAWLANQDETYFMIGQFASLATDKQEQDVLLSLLTLSIPRDWSRKQVQTLADELLQARQMWQSNVSLQNALEYIWLRK